MISLTGKSGIGTKHPGPQPDSINYFAPKRLFGYVMAAIFMLVAGLTGKGMLSQFQDWLWLREVSLPPLRG